MSIAAPVSLAWRTDQGTTPGECCAAASRRAISTAKADDAASCPNATHPVGGWEQASDPAFLHRALAHTNRHDLHQRRSCWMARGIRPTSPDPKIEGPLALVVGTEAPTQCSQAFWTARLDTPLRDPNRFRHVCGPASSIGKSRRSNASSTVQRWPVLVFSCSFQRNMVEDAAIPHSLYM